MKPRIQCALTQWNPGFIAFGQWAQRSEIRFHCVRRRPDLHDQHKPTENTVLVVLI